MQLMLILMAGILFSSSTTIVEVEKRRASLDAKLNEAVSYLPEMEIKNPEVSEAAVSWHIDHIFLVVNQIYKTLEQSEESDYKNEFNMTRAYVFTFNTIPRGKATAPEAVRPKDNIDIDTIQFHYDQALTTVEQFSDLPEKKHINHPVFGTLNRDRTIKFLTIHTEHHLKIIRDILKDK